MKKIICFLIIAIFTVLSLPGCISGEFRPENDITVISREEGSGTRGSFVELFGIEQGDENGERIDHTIETADINESTGIVLTNVSQNKNAIGYVSLRALNDTVKPLSIDGTPATVSNIKNGSYKITRAFNIATTDNISEIAQDFIDFVLSSDGQAIVEKTGYTGASESIFSCSDNKPSGKVVVVGSSSVTPLMEKLKEAYMKINNNAEIEIQQSDSTTGVNSVIEGICDIGMASRELKESEVSKGLISTKIAFDGIAVITNPNNPVDEMSIEEVKNIYTGKLTTWAAVIN
ncbi:MAG TPA: substrate-binding domain-containing protein [Clostridia bacterium]|nr:substrate-binding domain-containing protein [Clostridia bacterium]